MLNYEKLVLGEMYTNCYLVWEDQSKELAIIDPADDGVGIAEIIQIKRLNPKIILMTHGHFDHTMAALDLKLIFSIPAAVNSKDNFLLKRQTKSYNYFTKNKINHPDLFQIDVDLKDTNEIRLGDEKLNIINLPGHTPGSCCFYDEKQKWVFSGDIWLEGDYAETERSYTDLAELENSKNKIRNLSADTTIFPGHGDVFVVK